MKYSVLRSFVAGLGYRLAGWLIAKFSEIDPVIGYDIRFTGNKYDPTYYRRVILRDEEKMKGHRAYMLEPLGHIIEINGKEYVEIGREHNQ